VARDGVDLVGQAPSGPFAAHAYQPIAERLGDRFVLSHPLAWPAPQPAFLFRNS